MEECDVIIVGCGPAGLSAAIFCGRAELKTLIIGMVEKSQAQLAMHIENYFGFPEGVDGSMLLNKGIRQAQKFDVKFLKDEVVAATACEESGKKFFSIKTSKGENLKSRAMIIATGVPIRLSGIKNEQELTGKGVHYCVSCDGPLYKNKKLAIIGSGNHAAEDAVEALSYTKDITIISNATKFDFSENYGREIKKWRIETLVSNVKEFTGGKWFEGVVLEDGTKLKFDGVFMACGTAGALDFATDLGLEIRDNVLVVDENNMTSMEGAFAAGNCAGRCRQIAKNVGDGCNAAVNVIKYLRSRELYFDYVHGTSAQQTAQASSSTPVQAAVTTARRIAEPAAPKRKLRIGWFSFSCCEDSTIVFTEILNDYYDKIKSVADITYARALRKQNDMTNLDIAFVEGAISNEKAAEELRKIRENSKVLIAIGACAITGMPSGQRNTFDERRSREIEPIVSTFSYSKEVKPLHEIVKVDDIVPGCPMTETGFLAVMNRQIKGLGIDAQL
ncbi:MAG: FAD-dependent oxidoreductase [Candidatus Aenigmarchaeota archaeon]|nr:FAD-dependent oxidoreductase [Candidatus Aenigmarchaeota archaeon]